MASGGARTQGLSDLPETGTYTVILDPSGGAQGSLKLTLSADLAVDVAVDGASVSATAARPGQRIRARFTAGSDFVGVGLASNSINQTTSLNVIGSAGGDGTSVTSVSKNTTQAAQLSPLTAGAAYMLLLEPQSAGTGAVTLWLSTPAKAGALSQADRAGTISRPGQQLEYTLDAQAGDGASVVFTGTTLTGTTAIKLLSPGATEPTSLENLLTSATDAAPSACQPPRPRQPTARKTWKARPRAPATARYRPAPMLGSRTSTTSSAGTGRPGAARHRRLRRNCVLRRARPRSPGTCSSWTASHWPT
ncbi:hypothetical protein [Streptomyces sp. V4I2]|uniref:hypothetical protein n=1 Tax=Streptomyces sp. V4I2 TaxID=3042280 RepID=UPI0027D7C85B|nr:hypothetical protein [Streptomyces sp. V4I2]